MILPIQQKHFEWVKIFFLAVSFFCIIGTYTILREMRDVIFVSIVGCEYIQHAQILSMIFLVPCLLVYAALVDQLEKHHLLYFYLIIYGLGTILIGLLAADPIVGLSNSHVAPSRIFGWVQYLFIEGYAPFVISLFLAFVNSITLPQAAGVSYSYIIAASKIGGMISAISAWWFLHSSGGRDIYVMKWLFFAAAGLLLIVPLCIASIMSLVPEPLLRGYQASFESENQASKQPWFVSMMSGLTLMVRFPYAFGIFALVFFWEVISVIINYKRLELCMTFAKTASGLSSLLFLQVFWVYVAGFFISLIGTRIVLATIGERWGLVAVPVMTGALVVGYFLNGVPEVMFTCYILMRALNFSLAVSVREILYIPTTKEMRFKTKSWIDAFGAKCARGSGAFYSLVIERFLGSGHLSYLLFCMPVIGIWIYVAYWLGRKYQLIIKNNKVIG